MLPIQGIKLLGMAYYSVNSRIIINWETKQMSGECTARLMEHTRLLPKKRFKESTRPKAERLGAQHVKC